MTDSVFVGSDSSTSYRYQETVDLLTSSVTLTILPLLYLDCPYRTPLSEAFWSMSRGITRFLSRYRIADDSVWSDGEVTLVEAMSHAATEDTEQRDYRALVWTVKSLADDTEFEPFAEAIPDVLWGPKNPRLAYRSHFKSLMVHPDLEMHRRFLDLFRSCDTGLLLPEASKRRRIIYYKALWALGGAGALTPTDPRLLGLFDPAVEGDKEVKGYAISANAMVEWSLMCSAKRSLSQLSEFLARDDGAVDLDPELDRRLGPVKSYLFHQSGPMSRNHGRDLIDQFQSYTSRELIPQLMEEFETVPRQNLISYMTDSVFVGSGSSASYRYQDTVDLLTSSVGPPTYDCIRSIDSALSRLVEDCYDELETADSINWVDSVLTELSSMLRPSQTDLHDGPGPIPDAIIEYICTRKSNDALKMLLHRYDFHSTLFSAFLGKFKAPTEPLLCCLCRVTLLSLGQRDSADIYESLLNAAEKLDSQDSSSARIVTSLIALLRARVIRSFDFFDHPREFISRFLPTPTRLVVEEADSIDRDLERDHNDDLRAEALVAQLGEFLGTMQPNNLPYTAAATLNSIVRNFFIYAGIHERHQNRLADGLACLWHANSADLRQLLDAVLASHMFDVYAGTSSTEDRPLVAWLDDSGVRERIHSTLVAYLSANTGDSPNLQRARAILKGLESLHAVPSDE